MGYHISYNRSGLCNRLNNVINFMWLYDVLKEGDKRILYWPINDACGASFEDLFECNYFDKIYYDKLPTINNPRGITVFSAGGIGNLDTNKLLGTNNPNGLVCFWTKLLSPASERIMEYMPRLKIKNDIERSAEKFCYDNDINYSVFGLHVRSSEYSSLFMRKGINKKGVDNNLLPYKKRRNSAAKFIESKIDEDPGAKFIVCSDSKGVERFFYESYPDNIIFRKKTYVQKKYEEQLFVTNNIVRSKEQVIDALIDLLILSKTHFVDEGIGSSFSEWVKLFQHYRKGV